jgi:long-chain acyl-CoA synthetase
MRHGQTESSSVVGVADGTPPATLIALTRAALDGAARPLLLERDASAAWAARTNRDVLAQAEAIALALRARGLATGDRVALMSPNRVDWIVTNLGILLAGCVTVPIYATQALDQVAYILADSEARALFVDTPEVAARLRDAGITHPQPVVFDADPADERSLAAWIAAGTAVRDERAGELERIAAAVAPGDLAVLIYTSGTTGTPKGVMLSHGNITANACDAFGLIPDVITPGDLVLSVLPLAHIYENTNVFGYFLCGATIAVTRRVEGLLDDLRAIRPVAVFAVPRIFERTYAGIVAKARAAGGALAVLVPWALRSGLRYKQAETAGRGIGLGTRAAFALAHALVLRKLRAQLGCDRLRFFVSGSAALHPDILLTFAAADMLIMEGYGLTECSPVVTVNQPHRYKLGTVGTPIPDVEVRLGDDGELLVRGPNVMLGYYHQPDETDAVLHDDWLATGDIATIDAEGFVKIVDRKKEIFKTSGGKYVSPSRIETALLRSPYFSQAVVIGDGKPHPAALIAPNWHLLREDLKLPDAPVLELASRPDVRAFLAARAVEETADLASFEQIRWIGILPRDLTIEDGELTPTLKVKRRVVEKRYESLVPEY